MRSPGLRSRRLAEAYAYARQFVIERGFGSEIMWQETRSVDDLTESEFLRESAWVILSSGMKERVVRQRFPAISAAFLDWASATSIDTQRRACCRAAMKVFRHDGKVQAIGTLCGYVALKQCPCVGDLLAQRSYVDGMVEVTDHKMQPAAFCGEDT